MDSEVLKIYKQQETARFSEDDLQFIHDSYEKITGTGQRIPLAGFVVQAVLKANQQTTPKTIEISKPEDLQQIQKVNKLLSESKEIVSILEQRIAELENQPAPEPVQVTTERPLSENEILLNIPEKTAFLIKAEARRRKIEPAAVLIDLFTRQATEGPGDHLQKVYSNSELRRLNEAFQNKTAE